MRGAKGGSYGGQERSQDFAPSGQWSDRTKQFQDYLESHGDGESCVVCGRPAAAQEWIAVGPKGQRDVRNTAHPIESPGRWQFYHIQCVKDKKHAPHHPACARPYGPCTDWHLRGKCKRAFDCGHCHLDHPELLQKYPELPPGGVLRRPQRRERLQMLKSAYEDDVMKFLGGGAPGSELSKEHEMALLAFFFDQAECLETLNNRVSLMLLRRAVAGMTDQMCVLAWLDLVKKQPLVVQLGTKFVVEAEHEFRYLNVEELEDDDEAPSLARRFLECAPDFAQVVRHVTREPPKSEALFEDVMDYLVSAENVRRLVERLEELSGLGVT